MAIFSSGRRRYKRYNPRMKWVFYTLLVANGWYFATHMDDLKSSPPTERRLPNTPDATVNRLLLLSELDSGELKTRSEPKRPVAPVQVANVAQPTAATPAPQGSEFAASAPAESDRTGGEAASKVDEAPAAAPLTGVCFSFGPIADGTDLSGIEAWLQQQGGIAELRVGERRELSRYWVYFPPLPSRRAAVERVGQMRERGIEDIYIIPRGDMANAISLGVYSRQESLHRRVGELQRNGFEPSTVPRYKTEKASWLDAAFPSEHQLDAEAFSAQFKGIEVSDNACTPAVLAKLPRMQTPAAVQSEQRFVEPSEPKAAAATQQPQESAPISTAEPAAVSTTDPVAGSDRPTALPEGPSAARVA